MLFLLAAQFVVAALVHFVILRLTTGPMRVAIGTIFPLALLAIPVRHFVGDDLSDVKVLFIFAPGFAIFKCLDAAFRDDFEQTFGLDALWKTTLFLMLPTSPVWSSSSRTAKKPWLRSDDSPILSYSPDSFRGVLLTCLPRMLLASSIAYAVASVALDQVFGSVQTRFLMIVLLLAQISMFQDFATIVSAGVLFLLGASAVIPAGDAPLFSRSPSNFWQRQSSSPGVHLRRSVYEPLMRHGYAHSTVAMGATLAVNCIVHEIFFLWMMQNRVAIEYAPIFGAGFLAVALERWLKRSSVFPQSGTRVILWFLLVALMIAFAPNAYTVAINPQANLQSQARKMLGLPSNI